MTIQIKLETAQQKAVFKCLIDCTAFDTQMINEKIYGKDHINTVVVYTHLGILYLSEKRYD
jgi:hypothetical protein